MSEGVTTLYSRPGMHLTSYDKRLDAASFYLNFLTGVFFDSKTGYPAAIDIASTGYVFTISATNYALPISETHWKTLSDLFDVAHHEKTGEPYSGLEYLRPVVWFSEYCLISCTTSHGAYRQAFLQGRPLAPATYSAGIEEKAISFSFTLPSEMFEKTTLSMAHLKQAVAIWEKREFSQLTSNIGLKFNWHEQSEYHHSLRVEVI